MFSQLISKITSAAVTGGRTIRSFFGRTIGTKIQSVTQYLNINRLTNIAIGEGLKKIWDVGQTPSKREDFIETGSMYIAKNFILKVIVAIVVVVLVAVFFVYPYAMKNFFTARLYEKDTKLSDYTGKVKVYQDEDKTILAYEGYLKNGNLEGEGKEYDINGLLVYEGNYSLGMRSGAGVEYKNGQLIYKGEFGDDKYQGQGDLYEAGKLVYSGSFVSGKLEGYDCVAYYPNGRVRYKGQYTKGEQTGEGIGFFESGAQQYVGSFVKGNWDGTGTIYDENGKTLYSGSFVNNIYEGDGTLYLENGYRLDGTFSDGVQSGDAIIRKDGYVYYEGTAINGVITGQGTLYNQLGNVLYTGTFRGGTIDASCLLGLPMSTVKEMLGNVRFTEDNNKDSIILTSDELGLSLYFSYAASSKEEPYSYDVSINRTSKISEATDFIVWSFANDVDLWRNSVWIDTPVATGATNPQYTATLYIEDKYSCIIYQEDFCNCTIWLDKGNCFMIQWTDAKGLVATEKENAYIAKDGDE